MCPKGGHRQFSCIWFGPEVQTCKSNVGEQILAKSNLNYHTIWIESENGVHERPSLLTTYSIVTSSRYWRNSLNPQQSETHEGIYIIRATFDLIYEEGKQSKWQGLTNRGISYLTVVCGTVHCLRYSLFPPTDLRRLTFDMVWGAWQCHFIVTFIINLT